MGVVLDSKEDKSLAQLYSFLDIPIRRVAHRTGNGLLELILGCIGASSLIKEYGYFLIHIALIEDTAMIMIILIRKWVC